MRNEKVFGQVWGTRARYVPHPSRRYLAIAQRRACDSCGQVSFKEASPACHIPRGLIGEMLAHAPS